MNDHEELLNRISRIEGQVKSVRRLIESNAEPEKFVQQLKAAKNAMLSLGDAALQSKFHTEIVEGSNVDKTVERYFHLAAKYRG